MFRTSRRISDLETRVAALSLAVAEIRKQFELSLPHSVLQAVEAIRLDLDATKSSLRSLHGKVAIQKRLEPGNGRAAADIPGDGEFQSYLELQNGFRSAG